MRLRHLFRLTALSVDVTLEFMLMIERTAFEEILNDIEMRNHM